MKNFDPDNQADWDFFRLVRPILIGLVRKNYPGSNIIIKNITCEKSGLSCNKCLICDRIIYSEIGSHKELDHLLKHIREHKTLLNML